MLKQVFAVAEVFDRLMDSVGRHGGFRLQPAQVVYVACDPVALARDVATFAELGYRLDTLRAFDLFPHTHHLEAVARLVPADTAV